MNKILLVLGVLGVVVLSGIYFNTVKYSLDEVSKPFGSAIDGMGYNSTTTGSFAIASSTLLKRGPGILGVVTIGVTSPTTIRIMDANSITDSGSTTLVQLSASPASGQDYSLDVSFSRGLYLDVLDPSFVGRYTITWR